MLDLYGTLGPACASADTLEAMFRCGMTGVRLNLSHVTLRQAAGQIDSLHTAARRCGVEPKLLIDMQGPELRVSAMESPLPLKEGTQTLLGKGGIPVPEIVFPFLVPGQQVLLDDGKLLLEVTEQTEYGAAARVIRGGELKGRKSIALPGCGICPPTMTEQDRENISAAADYGVTGVMQPFVRNSDDLKAVRSALDKAGCKEVRLFAKIEDLNGAAHLKEFFPLCDEIVIARGDLGNAVPLWELPKLQKRISAECRATGKPFTVATQMLTSMEKNPVPTRAEVSDIYNAVLDGASSLIVTGETAVGAYPVEVIRYLANTAKSALY